MHEKSNHTRAENGSLLREEQNLELLERLSGCPIPHHELISSSLLYRHDGTKKQEWLDKSKWSTLCVSTILSEAVED